MRIYIYKEINTVFHRFVFIDNKKIII
jgi:hypothetical protein